MIPSQVLAQFGKAYLSSGGGTSQAEDLTIRLGSALGMQVDCFATPTGLMLSVYDPASKKTHSIISRVFDSSMNLSLLFEFEKMVSNVESLQGCSVDYIEKELNRIATLSSEYRLSWKFFAALLMGTAVSYSKYRHLPGSLVAGLITVAAYWVSGPHLKSLIPSGIVRDFLASFLVLMTASLLQLFWGLPRDILTIGGIILIVPGLTITTAVGELADQNYLSGTAKLMKGLLTLIAMGIAYVIEEDFFRVSTIHPMIFTNGFPSSLLGVTSLKSLISLGCIILSVGGFSVIFSVPRRFLMLSTLTGVIGWLSAQIVQSSQYESLTPLFSSLIVGTLSQYWSVRMKAPFQTFSVPGILALLPGFLALSSFRSFVSGQETKGLEIAFQVTYSAASIVFGLYCSRIPFSRITKLVKGQFQT